MEKSKKEFIDNVHKFILNGVKPNVTFILKVTTKSSQLRLKKEKQETGTIIFSKSFYSKAQKAFVKLGKNKKNYYILNSSLNNNILEKRNF